jgi:hypothetical protein
VFKDVTTRGSYFPDKSMSTPAVSASSISRAVRAQLTPAQNPPLYLHVTSTTKDGLEQAVKKIEELMSQELPNLIDERRFRRRDEPQREQVERDAMGRRKWPDKRIPIDLEPIPGFNLRAKVVGAGGSYVKHIQTETRCRVQIKGRGSGFMEHDTGVESDEQMYLHVAYVLVDFCWKAYADMTPAGRSKPWSTKPKRCVSLFWIPSETPTSSSRSAAHSTVVAAIVVATVVAMAEIVEAITAVEMGNVSTQVLMAAVAATAVTTVGTTTAAEAAMEEQEATLNPQLLPTAALSPQSQLSRQPQRPLTRPTRLSSKPGSLTTPRIRNWTRWLLMVVMART